MSHHVISGCASVSHVFPSRSRRLRTSLPRTQTDLFTARTCYDTLARCRQPQSESFAACRNPVHNANDDSGRAQSAFPFLRLPAELRNAIYEYVFEPRLIISDFRRVFRASQLPPETPVALLFVNRQIHKEAHITAYANYIWTFRRSASFQEFLTQRTSKQLAAIQHIELDSDYGCRMFDDCVRLSKYTFLVLSDMPSIKRIDINVLPRFKSFEGVIVSNLEESVGLIRSWVPEMKISARDYEGRWTENL
jgi:hypothetical protein